MLPNDTVEIVRRWANDNTPEEFRGRMRVEVEETPRGLTIFECSLVPGVDGEMLWLRVPIARLAYASGRREWTLYFIDSNDKARRYPDFEPSTNIRDLLDEIDDDPTCIFWG
jgi:Protein of unknown function (DUF3024)